MNALYNPKLFETTEDSVCEITWDGRDSYVVSCCGEPVGKVPGGKPIDWRTGGLDVVAACASLLGDVRDVVVIDSVVFATCRHA